MEPHRILVANEARFLREMLKRAFEKVPSLSVAGEITDPARLASAIGQTGAEWVIVSLRPDGAMPEMIEPLLAEYPAVRFLGVAMDGSQVKMKWIESREDVLEGPSLDDLIAILRDDLPASVRIRVAVQYPEPEVEKPDSNSDERIH